MNTMLKIDGMDEAIIGLASSFNRREVYAYSLDKILGILVERDGMDWEEAMEFYDFNIAGAYLGEGMPVVISYVYPGVEHEV
jgi:hypothetical protein